ncbi:MAG: phycobilisome rod-core linker polypeptide [Tychonema bourrellyi B0820]|uniref:Photosystem I reaction center subunit XII n=1 Tax=Tychonema bourrellyi FEM_GT703 TaxID=2040638 RepID=A0A2G4F6C6_9CYAN|nr:phycobilisome rod-core linker polypeptide [Tychonema bourrellyi]MDQ2098744.1 phycobilisome rod-core linker polypeptide [Tychonema bourrellyi B0820]PHX57343.1 photosystem I reaction center subunit XII [Tychonema bourrellyi FEM_GT703]
MKDSTYELWPTSGVDEVQAVIRAVYKQVLGNPHVMESERLVSAESQLSDRSISVREFVRLVAKSDFYSTRYFQKCAPYRFVELNFLHILGRAPQDQTEISEHIIRCVEQGYAAEIDSYIDSDEYQTAFGENIAPYYRGRSSEANTKQVGYNRMFALDRGFAQIDSAVKASQLVYAVATNSANTIKPATSRGGAYVATEKMFKIVVTGSKFDRPRRRSTTTYIVQGNHMSSQIQRINRTSGKIASITEIN